jgi:adenylate cyclase
LFSCRCGRVGYTAIGTVCNVVARLCGAAKNGEILLSQRVNVALRESVVTEQVGTLALKGQPVLAYNVPLVGSQAAFRVIEGGTECLNKRPLCAPAGRWLNDTVVGR